MVEYNYSLAYDQYTVADGSRVGLTDGECTSYNALYDYITVMESRFRYCEYNYVLSALVGTNSIDYYTGDCRDGVYYQDSSTNYVYSPSGWSYHYDNCTYSEGTTYINKYSSPVNNTEIPCK